MYRDFSILSKLFKLLFLFKDTHRKEAGVKRLAAELKEREDLDAEMESLRAEIKAVRIQFIVIYL